MLLEHLAMLVKDASQLVIENLAGSGAISRTISHAPSMSDLCGPLGCTAEPLASAFAAQLPRRPLPPPARPGHPRDKSRERTHVTALRPGLPGQISPVR